MPDQTNTEDYHLSTTENNKDLSTCTIHRRCRHHRCTLVANMPVHMAIRACPRQWSHLRSIPHHSQQHMPRTDPVLVATMAGKAKMRDQMRVIPRTGLIELILTRQQSGEQVNHKIYHTVPASLAATSILCKAGNILTRPSTTQWVCPATCSREYPKWRFLHLPVIHKAGMPLKACHMCVKKRIMRRPTHTVGNHKDTVAHMARLRLRLLQSCSHIECNHHEISHLQDEERQGLRYTLLELKSQRRLRHSPEASLFAIARSRSSSMVVGVLHDCHDWRMPRRNSFRSHDGFDNLCTQKCMTVHKLLFRHSQKRGGGTCPCPHTKPEQNDMKFSRSKSVKKNR